MKYYSYMNLDGSPLFDVVWGEPLEEDDTLAVFKRGTRWNILDIESGMTLCSHTIKSKKAILDWYNEERKINSLCMRLKTARLSDRVKEKVKLLKSHRILHSGDRCSYIDVKNSVILELVIYSPTKDRWLVKDEWHQFEVSPDKLIKVSEVD